MTKPDMLAELAEVVRLGELATAGKWGSDYRKNLRGYSQEVFDREGKTIATLAWHAVPKNETTTTTDREANAQLIAAAVNFVRTRHAELEAMARKSSRYDWLRDNGERMIGEDRGCGPEWTYGDDLDQAIDDAMRAENSHD